MYAGPHVQELVKEFNTLEHQEECAAQTTNVKETQLMLQQSTERLSGKLSIWQHTQWSFERARLIHWVFKGKWR
jgi:hypothetical protein